MRNAKGLRQAALRKAQQAKQERDAKRLRRERQVEAALAEFFEHTAASEAIEQATAAKIAALSAAAVAAVNQERVHAAVAVRAMLDLGETRTAVAELTGLTLPGVRDLLGAVDEPGNTSAYEANTARTAIPELEAPDVGGYEPSVRDDAADGYNPPPALEAASYDPPPWVTPGSPSPPDWQDPPDWTRPETSDRWTT